MARDVARSGQIIVARVIFFGIRGHEWPAHGYGAEGQAHVTAYAGRIGRATFGHSR